MCCCDSQTHVIAINIIGMIFAGFSLLSLTHNILSEISYESGLSIDTDDNKDVIHDADTQNNNMAFLYYIWSSVNLIVNTTCLFGAFKRIKLLLLPYIITAILWITLLTIGIFVLSSFGFLFTNGGSQIFQAIILLGGIQDGKIVSENDTHEVDFGFGIFFFIVLTAMLTALGLFIYVLAIAAMFYKELSSGGETYQPNRIAAIYPYSSSQYSQQEVILIPSNQIPSLYPQELRPPYPS